MDKIQIVKTGDTTANIITPPIPQSVSLDDYVNKGKQLESQISMLQNQLKSLIDSQKDTTDMIDKLRAVGCKTSDELIPDTTP